METRFEWDPKKAAANWRKHRVSFETAVLALGDPHALSEQDRVENGELRWRIIGMVEGSLLLTVAHAVREEEMDGEEIEVVRIISARPAVRSERRSYEEDPR